MSWIDELNKLLAGRRPVVVQPRDADLSLARMPVTGPGTPNIGEGKMTAVSEAGPTPFPDIDPSDAQEQKYARRYARLLQLSRGTSLSDYMGALFPSLPLAAFQPEDFFPDEMLAMANPLAPQLAANFSIIGLTNPLNSGILAITEELQVWRRNTAGEMLLLLGGSAAAGGGRGARDQRMQLDPGLSPPKAFPLAENNVAASTGIGKYRGVSGAAQNPWIIRVPIILMPGTRFEIEPVDAAGPLVNEGMVGGFAWREIALPTVA